MTAKICARCVMDTTDPLILFDAEGICNHCREFERVRRLQPIDRSLGDKPLRRTAAEIRERGAGLPYDCVVGISGGVDSSYIVHLARVHKLRPLLVHLDNGWNSETAVTNIRKLVETSGFDLYTHVIDWAEFRDLQRAFLEASVIDIELLTDHAISSALYAIARKHRIPYSLAGENLATESGMPASWVWWKGDRKNILAIHKRYGRVKLKTFPTMTWWRRELYLRFGFGCRRIPVLDLIDYRKSDALKVLAEVYDWVYYGGKHYESVFTRFYQAYILPTKFKVDKRRAHLSSLIRNGETSRSEALDELKTPLYEPAELRQDKDFVMKKLGYTSVEFEAIMVRTPVRHDVFPTSRKWYHLVRTLKAKLRTIASHSSTRQALAHAPGDSVNEGSLAEAARRSAAS